MLRHLASTLAVASLVLAGAAPAHGAGSETRTYVNGQSPVANCAAPTAVDPAGAPCFVVSGGSVSVAIDDVSGLDVAATVIFQRTNGPLGATVLTSTPICNARTLAVPSGADRMVVYLGGADDTALSLRNQGPCPGAAAATAGTITATF